ESYESASPLFPFCVVLREGDADNCHSSRLALVRSSHYRAACAGSWPSPPVAGNWFPRSAHVESGVDWVGAALQRLRLSQVRKQTGTGVSGRLRGGESFIGGQHICLRGALPGFRVPRRMQHRVLFWGIIGALLMRGLFIAGGSALLAQFHWILYLFGLFLLLTGIRLLVRRHAQPADPKANPLYRLFTRFVPTASHYSEDRFFVLADGRWLATPLFASLVAIEAVDVVFALDSIPAIFAITTDPFIVL